jgi:CheY-like chemotaxis protein
VSLFQGAEDSLQAHDPEARPVLVVEDDAGLRTYLVTILEHQGYRVVAAGSGEEALELLGEQKAMLAVLDIGLPGMDGYEVARRVRELPEGKTLKLIALTGFGGDKYRRRAQEAGFDLHVVKPISYEQLVRVFAEA